MVGWFRRWIAMDRLGWTYLSPASPTPFLALNTPFLTNTRRPSRPRPNGHLKIYQGKDRQYDRLPRTFNPLLTLFLAKTPSKETKAKNAKKAALVGAHSTTKRKVRTTVSFHRPKTLRLARSPKYPRKSIPHAPRMDQYRVIIS